MARTSCTSTTRWFLVFCNGEHRLHWWDRLARTRDGFRHVYAVRFDGKHWLLYNPHAAYTEVSVMDVDGAEALARLAVPGSTVIEVEAHRDVDRIRGRWWCGPMTCVEQMKALLGISAGRVFTPWQLHRYLIAQQDRSIHCNQIALAG